ncbi:MAG: glucosamine-6-phosphate deaminase, partial [Candidatus Omnitrophica bacterium]|nr:glucosamine-6-phosphate deaminase [Candidatus Omnitrophota bacterium]
MFGRKKSSTDYNLDKLKLVKKIIKIYNNRGALEYNFRLCLAKKRIEINDPWKLDEYRLKYRCFLLKNARKLLFEITNTGKIPEKLKNMVFSLNLRIERLVEKLNKEIIRFKRSSIVEENIIEYSQEYIKDQEYIEDEDIVHKIVNDYFRYNRDDDDDPYSKLYSLTIPSLPLYTFPLILYFIALHYRKQILSWSLWQKAPPVILKVIKAILFPEKIFSLFKLDALYKKFVEYKNNRELINHIIQKDINSDEAIGYLRKIVRESRLPVVLVIDGESGAGKTPLARRLRYGALGLTREEIVVIPGDHISGIIERLKELKLRMIEGINQDLKLIIYEGLDSFSHIEKIALQLPNCKIVKIFVKGREALAEYIRLEEIVEINNQFNWLKKLKNKIIDFKDRQKMRKVLLNYSINIRPHHMRRYSAIYLGETGNKKIVKLQIKKLNNKDFRRYALENLAIIANRKKGKEVLKRAIKPLLKMLFYKDEPLTVALAVMILSRILEEDQLSSKHILKNLLEALEINHTWLARRSIKEMLRQLGFKDIKGITTFWNVNITEKILSSLKNFIDFVNTKSKEGRITQVLIDRYSLLANNMAIFGSYSNLEALILVYEGIPDEELNRYKGLLRQILEAEGISFNYIEPIWYEIKDFESKSLFMEGNITIYKDGRFLEREELKFERFKEDDTDIVRKELFDLIERKSLSIEELDILERINWALAFEGIFGVYVDLLINSYEMVILEELEKKGLIEFNEDKDQLTIRWFSDDLEYLGLKILQASSPMNHWFNRIKEDLSVLSGKFRLQEKILINGWLKEISQQLPQFNFKVYPLNFISLLRNSCLFIFYMNYIILSLIIFTLILGFNPILIFAISNLIGTLILEAISLSKSFILIGWSKGSIKVFIRPTGNEIEISRILSKLKDEIIEEAYSKEKEVFYFRNLKIYILKDHRSMSKKVAELLSNDIKRIIFEKDKVVVAFPTGSTPEELYRLLAKDYKRSIDWSKVVVFMLDEYLGLSKEHPSSYSYYILRKIIKPLGIKRFYLLDGASDEPKEECNRYEDAIRREGGLDIVVLGIGRNGHIAFNEPGSSFNSRTRIVNLDLDTIQANARFFKNITDVPQEAITLGIATIMEAKKIYLLASGKNKSEIIFKTLKGPITEKIPASILRRHLDVNFILDRQASLKIIDGGSSSPLYSNVILIDEIEKLLAEDSSLIKDKNYLEGTKKVKECLNKIE